MKFIIDFDSVVACENIFKSLSKRLEVEESISDVVRMAEDRNIEYVEYAIRCINLLGKDDVKKTRSIVNEILLNSSIVEFIKQHTANCIVFSESFSSWISDFESVLGTSIIGSECIVDNGKIVKIRSILHPNELVSQYKGCGEQVTVVGGFVNSIEAMRNADLAIAVGINGKPSSSLYSVCDYIILNEKALCRQLNQLL